jgi:hypothetical protein
MRTVSKSRNCSGDTEQQDEIVYDEIDLEFYLDTIGG